MGYGKINGTQWLDEKDREWLASRAAEGDTEAMVEQAALNVEDGVDVEKNLAFLNERAESGDTHALIDLGFIYEGDDVTRTEADGSTTVLVAEDRQRAEECFRKAAERGSAYGMKIMGTHAWLKAVMHTEPTKAQDFIDAEKWLCAAVEASRKVENDLNHVGVLGAMDMLADIYASDHPENPIRNDEKAREWKAREEAMKAETAEE